MLRPSLLLFVACVSLLSACNRGTTPGRLQNAHTFEQQSARPDPQVIPEPATRPARSAAQSESEIERLRRENEALRRENASLKGQNP